MWKALIPLLILLACENPSSPAPLVDSRGNVVDADSIHVLDADHMRRETPYKNGVPHGTEYSYWKKEGFEFLFMVTPYENGKKHGVEYRLRQQIVDGMREEHADQFTEIEQALYWQKTVYIQGVQVN